MPFRIVGRTGSQMRQVVGFGDQSTGRGTFGGEFRSRHCNQWGLYGVRVRSALTVGAVVWGRACGGPKHCCIRWGPHRARGRGVFGGLCSPFSEWEMPLGRNVFDSYAKT